MLEPTTAEGASVGAERGSRVARTAALACAALFLTSCGDVEDPLDAYSTAETLSRRAESADAIQPPEAAPSSATHAADAARAEQLARGEVLSFACRPCHGLAPGDESPVGPHLHGMFGRPAGTLEGFEYSPALRQSGIVWTAEALDAWLARPDAFLPGNDMEFAGFRSTGDRQALIEYLRIRTSPADGAAEPPQAADRTSN